MSHYETISSLFMLTLSKPSATWCCIYKEPQSPVAYLQVLQGVPMLGLQRIADFTVSEIQPMVLGSKAVV